MNRISAKPSLLAGGFFVLVSLLAAPPPAGAGDPELIFSTIETEHFNIHYHQGLERIARLAAAIAENVHLKLTTLFGWEVDGPTEVVINDPTDSANGWARASPRPQIQLYATAPALDSSLASYDHWLRTLITHEYTHVIHLQMHGGVAKVINAIFGDVYLPNQMQPTWFIEGMAVMDETYFTTAGRIRSASYRMMMRADALEGKLLSLGELSNYTRDYPRGQNHYVYGAMFVDWLRARFGTEKLIEICREYGSEPIPYGLNRVFERVLGEELVSLYREWLSQVRVEAEQARRRVREAGLDESARITFDGETKGWPIFSRDGRAAIVAIADGLERPGIFELPLDGSPRERIVLSGSKSRVSLDRAGRLFYVRAAPVKNTYHFSDVFALDSRDGEPRRLTTGLRARSAAISPGGDRLALTLNEAGTSRLVLADERGNPLRTLIDSEPDDQVYDPSWSPDGRSIAAVVRRDHEVDLVLVDVDTGDVKRITDDAALDRSPVFDPGGRYLLFASDRSGIFDIYAYDFETEKTLRATGVVTGAVFPAVSPDGERLAFLQYHADGWDLHVKPFEPESYPPAGPCARPEVAPEPAPDPVAIDSEPYNPLPSLLPRHWELNWTAVGGSSMLQAATSMNDATGRHNVGAQLNWGISEQTLNARAGYSYGGLRPGLHLGFSRSMNPRNDGYEVGGDERRWTQVVTTGSLRLSAPIYAIDRSHNLSVGYSVTHARPLEEPETELDPRAERPVVPSQYFRAGIDFGWSFSEVESSVFGVSPENGRRVSAGVALYHPALGGNQTMATFRYRWTEYLEAPWLDHHVFALGLRGGVHVSDPPQQGTFSVGGYRQQSILDNIINNTGAALPSLRGYPPGSFQGDRMHSLRLEYRFPVWWAEAAYETLPAFFRRVHAAVFSDNVLIDYERLDRGDWKSSVGGELIWQIWLGYYQPMNLRTGYAYGIMHGGTHEVIIVLGSSF